MKIQLTCPPQELKDQALLAIESINNSSELKKHESIDKFINLLIASEWARAHLLNQPELVINPLLSGKFDQIYDADIVEKELLDLFKQHDFSAQDLIKLMCDLRNFRKQQTLWIAYRDINQLALLEETLAALSHLATMLVRYTLQYLYEKEAKRFGYPCNQAQEPIQPILLGMGKLGGNELNFSSDIDLVMFYPEEGETNGDKVISNQQFFNKVVQGLFKILDSVTEHGIVYRVDFRLRPFGESGALTLSQKAMERYYFDVGRDWERYALIKARPIAGNIQAGEIFLENIQDFIYRSYIDYTTLASLRSMKGMITEEVNRKGLARNVKLGPGGIREIEFIGQAFQLIYGGREPELRQRSILRTLEFLGEHNRIPATKVEQIIHTYHFLRHVENRVQLFLDLQTHDLPIETNQKLRLAWSMGFGSWAKFVEVLLKNVAIVKETFIDLFGEEDDLEFYEEQQQFIQLWKNLDAQNLEVLNSWLQELSFTDTKMISKALRVFKKDYYADLDKPYKNHCDRIIFYGLMRYKQKKFTESSFLLFMQALGNITKFPAYLALLTENKKALKSLIALANKSPWIAEYLGSHPLLLDELLAPREKIKPLSRKELTKELNRNLSQFSNKDYERKLDVLRDFHHIQTLKVATSDLSGHLPLMIVSDHLTDIAEVILAVVLRLAWKDLSERFGEPIIIEDSIEKPAEFIIVAYGKLGGIETGYGSDLDLVFLHNANNGQTNGQRFIDNEAFFVRLAQRIMSYLNTKTSAGSLYDVDTRLRPSGESGLLAVSVERFTTYQKSSAWTWEHQALIRARVVAGSQNLAKHFKQIRQDVLMQKRIIANIKLDVLTMREKMRNLVAKADNRINPIQACMINIEFIVQYMVLAYAYHFPILIKFTDNIRQLAGLEANGLISSWEAMVLRDTYRKLRSCLHQAKLKGQNPADIELDDTLIESIKTVENIWQEIIES